MLPLALSLESRLSENIILTLASKKQNLRKRYPLSRLQKVESPKTLSLLSFPESRFSESVILTLVSRKQDLRKCNPWDCLLEVGYACLFIESLLADRVGAYYIRLTKRYQRWRGMSCFCPLRGRLWGVFDTPLQPDTCDPSKYRCNFPTGYVWPFKKQSCFRPLRGRLWGVCDTSLRPGTCDPSKYRCNSPTGYVRPFKKLSRFRPLRGRL